MTRPSSRFSRDFACDGQSIPIPKAVTSYEQNEMSEVRRPKAECRMLESTAERPVKKKIYRQRTMDCKRKSSNVILGLMQFPGLCTEYVAPPAEAPAGLSQNGLEC